MEAAHKAYYYMTHPAGLESISYFCVACMGWGQSICHAEATGYMHVTYMQLHVCPHCPEQ
jgi:hypothetical protein